MEITYEIKKEKGVTKIIKSGMVEEFTLEQLEDTIKYNEKMKAEQEANMKLRMAELENVIKFYPKVLKLTDEEVFRIAMYKEKLEDVTAYKEKIKQFKKKLAEQNKILKLATNEQ